MKNATDVISLMDLALKPNLSVDRMETNYPLAEKNYLPSQLSLCTPERQLSQTILVGTHELRI